MPNSKNINTDLKTSRLMICMTSIPAAVFAPSSDRMTKSEKVRKTPETNAQAMTEAWHRTKNQYEAILTLRNANEFPIFRRQ
jgi:hypothetical protein